MTASLPVPVWVAAAAVLGLAIGSFLNVVIHRAPARMSLSTPASRCPRCGTPILARHNVPVLGWLVLRGRCASCRAPISVRYPLVEAATAVLFAAVTWPLAASDRIAFVPAALWLVAAGFTAVMILADRARPSRRFVVVAVVVLVALSVVGAVL